MRKILKWFIVPFAFALASLSAFAQDVPVTVTINWTNPTTTEPPASLPLTGAYALTNTDFVVAKSPIPANFAGAPSFSVTPTLTTTNYTLQASNGDTVYVRMRSCNKPAAIVECSGWTNEVSKVIAFSTKPNMPTSVSFTITLTP